jgi:hypothetical protein
VIRRSFRIGLWLGLLTGIGVAIAKIFRPRPEQSAVIDLGRPTSATPHEWPPLETPASTGAVTPEPALEPQRVEQAAKKPADKKSAPKKTLDPWVDPDGNVCPETHPVKGKLSSKIFQVPGNFAYGRTNPDRCYESAEAAAADGMRPAKR